MDSGQRGEQRVATHAVGGAPEARGFVLNTHANGPVVYGIERYSLLGAEPSTTYQVTLTVFADSDPEVLGTPTCTIPALVFATAGLTTNRVGNGQAKATFSAQEVAQLVTEPMTVTGRWTFSLGEDVAYATGCHEIALDVPPPPPPGHARRGG